MKSLKFISVILLLLLSTQSIFAGRYYSSKTGRWLTVDPMAYKYPGLSPYNYTLNNPLNNIDPDGNEPITISTTGVVVGGAITIALVGHTYNYLTNPSYRSSYDSFTSSVADITAQAATDIWDKLSNMFNEDESSGDGGNSGGAQTKEQLEKAKGSYEGLVEEHEKSLKNIKMILKVVIIKVL